MSAPREILTWQGFGAATRELSRRIVASGFRPEVVVAIARGGLLPAGAIAYGLGVKNCGAINMEFYTGIGTVLDAPELLPPELDMTYLDGRRVLLVDDVLATARAAGADPVHDAVAREWGGYTGYFGDPDGYRWEVAYNPGPIGQVVLP